MTRLRWLAALAAAVLGLGLGLGLGAASASGPPVTAPSSGPGPYYSGPVHICVNTANEGTAYFELHSTQLGNCAGGYRQLAANELTPAFTLQLGATAYQCTAATDAARTAIACSVPSSSSTG